MRMSLCIGLPIAGIFILIPALYLQLIEWTWIISSLERVLYFDVSDNDFPETIRRIKAANLTSILEISIGVNLALSVVEAFASFIKKNFMSDVAKLNPEHNPTLMEAMAEAAAKAGKELGTALDVKALQTKFTSHLLSRRAGFETHSEGWANWVKKLGFSTALVSFWILVRISCDMDPSIPSRVAHLVWFGAAFPILIHIIGSYILSWLYLHDVSNFDSDGIDQPNYKNFVQSTMKIYKEKRSNLSAVDAAIK